MFSRPYTTDSHYGMGSKTKKTPDEILERHSNNSELRLLFRTRDYRMTQWDSPEERAKSILNAHKATLADLDIEQIIAMRLKRTEMLKCKPQNCTVESSPSNRAKCVDCDQLIDHRVLRFNSIKTASNHLRICTMQWIRTSSVHHVDKF
jgi:hypothetical protein